MTRRSEEIHNPDFRAPRHNGTAIVSISFTEKADVGNIQYEITLSYRCEWDSKASQQRGRGFGSDVATRQAERG